jgi:hypothetical protein
MASTRRPSRRQPDRHQRRRCRGGHADRNGRGPWRPLTFSLEQGPQNGTVVINADGSYVYTPDEGVTGQDSFTFRVTDGQGAFDIATVEIEIAGVGESCRAQEHHRNRRQRRADRLGAERCPVRRAGQRRAAQRRRAADLFRAGPVGRRAGRRHADRRGRRVPSMVGGPGNDVLTRVDTGHLRLRACRLPVLASGDRGQSDGRTIGDLAPGEVADGFGTVDHVSNRPRHRRQST